MKAKALAIILMGIAIAVLFLAMSQGAEAATIVVDANGTPGVDCDYTTIQAAIDNATEGDTIEVAEGTYYENLVVNKPITIRGCEESYTDIYSQSGEETILVYANGTKLEYLHCFDANYSLWSGGRAGIKIDGAHDVVLSNCGAAMNGIGIQLLNSHNCTIIDCYASYNARGIRVSQSSYCKIIGTVVEWNDSTGISVNGQYGKNLSVSNEIRDCEINFNGYVDLNVNSGIYMSATENSIISNCTANSNDPYGIMLVTSWYNIVENCSTANNLGVGIYISGSAYYNVVYQCEVSI
ncbi:MAG: right-handed parallel beta-helix repeat-containing protein, partial [Candidatus Thermoplasmatota archaeon]|nr:right-handed parallel beta-helix repeat-containing protein [Candidatus Thermoplasmatota archaeon]